MDNASLRNEIVTNLLVILDNLPPEKIILLRKHLDKPDNITLTEIKEKLELSGIPYSAVGFFLMNRDTAKSLLLLALDTAIAVREHELRNSQQCELIWTGPIRFPIAARNTMLTMIEMIRTAKKKVTVVGYRIEEYALPIIKSLQDAIARNVDVILVLDKAEDHIFVLERLWKNFPTSKLYTMTTDPKDPKRSLHAKLIIIDYTVLLITSANLTYHGLSSNLEMGVKVTGKAAYEAQLLINSLMREGYLVTAK